MFILAADRGPGALIELIPGISHERVVDPGECRTAGCRVLHRSPLPWRPAPLLGLFNGLLLVWTRIPSFIVTLGTLYIYRSVMLNIIPGGTIARYLREPIVWDFNTTLIVLLVVVVMVLLGVLLSLSHPAKLAANAEQRRQSRASVPAEPGATGADSDARCGRADHQ